jgi:hypothetical protein
MVYWERSLAEFHLIASNPLLSPKQHKETANDGNFEDLGPTLNRSGGLFGFPQTVYADVRTTRKF